MNTSSFSNTYSFSIFASVIIYICIIFGTVICMNRADNSKSKVSSYAYLIMCFLILAFPACVRFNVGNDYVPFLKLSQIFGGMTDIKSALSYHKVEQSFVQLCFLLHDTPMLIFAIYAFFTQLLMVYGIWQFRDVISPSMCMFVYATTFYLRTLNIFRQSLAIAIVFVAMKFVLEKKFVKYIIAVLIATVFHNSAIVATVIYFMYQENRGTTWLQRILFFSWPILIAVLSDNLLNAVYSSLGVLNKYADSYGVSEKSVSLASAGLQILIYAMYTLNRKIMKKELQTEVKYRMIDKAMLMQLIFSFASYKLEHAARIGLYFSIMFIVGLATFKTKGKSFVAKTDSKEMIYVLFVVVYCIYTFINTLISNRFTSLPFQIWTRLEI